MKSGAATIENSVEVPQKFLNQTIIWPSNSSSGYLSEKNKNKKQHNKKPTNLKTYTSLCSLKTKQYLQ